MSSRDSDVDPVGACVGMKGSRVQAVVQELRGEKIDIVPYSEDPARFVCNAIAPAEVDGDDVAEDVHLVDVAGGQRQRKPLPPLLPLRVKPSCCGWVKPAFASKHRAAKSLWWTLGSRVAPKRLRPTKQTSLR